MNVHYYLIRARETLKQSWKKISVNKNIDKLYLCIAVIHKLG